MYIEYAPVASLRVEWEIGSIIFLVKFLVKFCKVEL